MVLIIDDETDMQDILLELLYDEGIEAHATGPQEAITTLHTLLPDVVLLDLSMPGLDGYAVLDHMRADPRLCRAYVIMVTGHGDLEALETTLDHGADDYVRKPFGADEMIARVRMGLKASGSCSPRYPAGPAPNVGYDPDQDRARVW